MTQAAASQLEPTSRRAIPLQARSDLVAVRNFYRGEGNWVVKDPVSLRYHRLLDEQYAVLQALDGGSSLEDIRALIRRQFPTVQVTLTQVQAVVMDLFEKGLLISERPGQAGVLIERRRTNRRRKLLQTLMSLLYLRLPGWDPERVLSRLLPLVRWMFRPWAVAVCCTLVVASWVLLGVQFDHYRRTLPEFQQFFGWPNLLYLWLTLAAAKILHEFGHGLACKYYGGECHEMGLMLLVFSPCLYCDVTDSWLLRNKWHRIAIAAAGMYVELILSSLALFLWWWTNVGLLHHLCFNVFTVTMLTTIVFNANPLMRFDGYYILSDLLEIPNLREKASRRLREAFAWYCLGIPSQPDPFTPDSGRGWLALFALASTLYRWFLLFVITLFLYTFLKPYGLQSIGVALAVVSVGGIVVSTFLGIYRAVTVPRSEPMSYRKIAMTLVVCGLLVAAAMSIPFSLHAEAPFVIEPEHGRPLEVSVPGRLIAVHVRPGDRVERGQLLAELEDPDLSDRLRAKQTELSVVESRIRMFRSLDDAAGVQLETQRRENIKSQLADYRQRLEHLKLRAPIDGIVVVPPLRPERVRQSTEEPLPKWHGTPLDPRNIGCYLERKTHVLTVAPTERLVAVALVDQSHRNEIAVGSHADLKVDHLPSDIYQGKVQSISRRQEQFAPLSLSNKYGGQLPTVTESSRERLLSVVYPVTIPLPPDTHLFRAGMRGRARFLLDRRSAGDWVWRYLRQTFQFRL